MKKDSSSLTALRVAMRRAAHQVIDDPIVFSDPLAFHMLGMRNQSGKQLDLALPEQTPVESRYRAYLAARSRYAEDELHAAVKRGITQYVILGAGLDTFAYRNPYPDNVLHVYEVDHPATQAWKQERLREADIQVPGTLTFTPVNFETETLEDGLRRVAFDTGKRVFFSWLGVTAYITNSAFIKTLRFVASRLSGSEIVFDYMISPSLLNQSARNVFEKLANRVASAGEPFQNFLDPSALKKDLQGIGFKKIRDLDSVELNKMYFSEREDELKAGGLAHIIHAMV